MEQRDNWLLHSKRGVQRWQHDCVSPMLTRGGICVPSTVTYLPYRVSGSTLTAVGRSQLLAR